MSAQHFQNVERIRPIVSFHGMFKIIPSIPQRRVNLNRSSTMSLKQVLGAAILCATLVTAIYCSHNVVKFCVQRGSCRCNRSSVCEPSSDPPRRMNSGFGPYFDAENGVDSSMLKGSRLRFYAPQNPNYADTYKN